MAGNGTDVDEAELMASSAPHSHVEGSPLTSVSSEDPFAIGQLPATGIFLCHPLICIPQHYIEIVPLLL
jgi:hypothetical protein